MRYRALALTTLLLLVSCSNSTSSASTAQSKSSAIPASAIKHETRVGTFYVQAPKSYIGLKNVDPAFFAVYQKQNPKLELVEVFLDKGDYEYSKSSDQMMQKQIVYLQIFPEGVPLITDALWGQLRERLPEILTGNTARAHLKKGIDQAKDLHNQTDSNLRIAGMKVGDLVVYNNSEESVRWATSAELTLEGTDAPVKMVVASAARRVGGHVYLVQTATPVTTEQDTLRAVSSLDEWLKNIWSSP